MSSRMSDAGCEGRGFRGGLDVGDEIRSEQLASREVHAHLPRGRRVGRQPRAQLLARLREHPLAERDDQPRVLRDRDELGRRHRAALGVGPAGQRLEAHHLTGVEPHDRLERHADVALLHSAFELAPDREAVDRAVVHGRLEQLDAALAVRLGRVHREVGVAQQLVRRGGGPAARGDADAGAGVHLAARHHDRLVQRVEDPLGHLDHRLGVGSVLEEHRELVAAQPSRRVAGAKAAAQAIGHGHQELVTGTVAQAVVHQLEVVEVDEGHRGDRRVGASDASQSMLDAVEEERPVRQAGEGIVEGLVAELVLERAATGDVADGEHDPVHVRVVEEVHPDDLGMDHRVVGPQQPGVHGANGLGGATDQLIEERRHVGDGVGVQHPVEVGAVEVDGEVAQHPDHRRRLVADAAVAPEDQHRVAAVADELLEARLAPLLVELLGLHQGIQGESSLGAEDGQALVDLVGHPLVESPPRDPRAPRCGTGSARAPPRPGCRRRAARGAHRCAATCRRASSTVESARSIGPRGPTSSVGYIAPRSFTAIQAT